MNNKKKVILCLDDIHNNAKETYVVDIVESSIKSKAHSRKYNGKYKRFINPSRTSVKHE